MAFELLPLRAEDAERCVTIYFAAFQNSHSLACWPRSPGIRAWWETMIREELDEAGSHWFKAVSIATGDIAGFVKWQQPKPGVEPDTNLPAWPEEADHALCDETFGAWAKMHRQLFADRDLEIVATDPAYQGRGAGSQMVRWGVERAEQDGVESYLEASPDAVPLYEKFGFGEAGVLDTFIRNERVEGQWYREVFMVRPAKSAPQRS